MHLLLPTARWIADLTMRLMGRDCCLILDHFEKNNGEGRTIEQPRSKLMRYQNIAMGIYPKGVTPECLNRGSTMLTTTLSQVEWSGVRVPVSPGFPT